MQINPRISDIHIWFDGVCKKCGYPVIETPDDFGKDYMNMCLNKRCEEHTWHSIYDTEELEYYTHVSEEIEFYKPTTT